MDYLSYKEFVDRAPHNVGETIRVEHGFGCEGDSKALRIRRKNDRSISARCFRCGKSGFYSTDKQDGRSSNQGSVGTAGGSSHNVPNLRLPKDSRYPDGESRRYLKESGIKDDEIRAFGIQYSPFFNRLVYPVYVNGQLEGYQLRQLDENDGFPKFVTKGFKTKQGFHINNNNKNLFIVEDYLSNIKCARVADSFALLSSNINTNILSSILNYDKYYIYLDNDNSIIKVLQRKITNRLSLFGETKLILEDRDPKYLTTDELRSLL